MTIPVIALFNNKGGVGKTALVYHLAWMFAELGADVLAADFDPQANLTAAFLDDDRLVELWSPSGSPPATAMGALGQLVRGTGDVREPHVEPIADRLGLLPGDLDLTRFEDELSKEWPNCLDGQERAFRVWSAFWRMMQTAATRRSADLVLLDLGPNLGALNRAGLIATDHVLFPLAPDLFSLRGLENVGPTVRRWRTAWEERLKKNPAPELPLPAGTMHPAGYVVMQHAVRLNRPVKAYEQWVARIPETYARAVLERPPEAKHFEDDPHCLALLKHYRSLMPLAQEARKPIFALKPADGAIGAHQQAVADVRRDFERLARTIAQRCLPDLQLHRA